MRACVVAAAAYRFHYTDEMDMEWYCKNQTGHIMFLFGHRHNALLGTTYNIPI